MASRMCNITIISSTLNALSLLKLTAGSIFCQTIADWQWIIVDGASIDGTVDWLQEISQEHQNVSFISEPDHGIYDAWNKALPLIQGDWVLFLGAGDKLKSATTLEQCSLMLAAAPPGQGLAYGSVELIDHPQDIAGELSDQRWQGVLGSWGHGRPATPNHQGMFHCTSLFRSGRKFDATYRIAGDTALILPELLENGGHDMGITVSLMLKGGVSGNVRNKILMLREILRVNRSCGLAWKRIHYQYAAFLYHIAEAYFHLTLHRLGKMLASFRSNDS